MEAHCCHHTVNVLQCCRLHLIIWLSLKQCIMGMYSCLLINLHIRFHVKLHMLNSLLCFVTVKSSGHPRDASSSCTLFRSSQEQRRGCSIRLVSLLKAAEICMVCANRLWCWLGNCIGSWDLVSVSPACSTLPGMFCLVIVSGFKTLLSFSLPYRAMLARLGCAYS